MVQDMVDLQQFRVEGLVLVKWVDSHHDLGWHDGEPETEPLECYSAGWIIHDGEEALTITGHISLGTVKQRAGEMTIPRACVKSIHKLGSVPAASEKAVALPGELKEEAQRKSQPSVAGGGAYCIFG